MTSLGIPLGSGKQSVQKRSKKSKRKYLKPFWHAWATVAFLDIAITYKDMIYTSRTIRLVVGFTSEDTTLARWCGSRPSSPGPRPRSTRIALACTLQLRQARLRAPRRNMYGAPGTKLPHGKREMRSDSGCAHSRYVGIDDSEDSEHSKATQGRTGLCPSKPHSQTTRGRPTGTV